MKNEVGRKSQSKALKRAGDRALGTWQERGDEATSPDNDKVLDSRFGSTSTLLDELGLTYPSGPPYPFPKVKPKINLSCSLQSTGWLYQFPHWGNGSAIISNTALCQVLFSASQVRELM